MKLDRMPTNANSDDSGSHTQTVTLFHLQLHFLLSHQHNSILKAIKDAQTAFLMEEQKLDCSESVTYRVESARAQILMAAQCSICLLA